MEVKRSSVGLFAARVGMSVVGFAATVYFARTLGDAALGIYFTFEAAINVLGVFSRVGLDSAVIKRISEREDVGGGKFTGALLIVFVTTALFAVILSVFHGQVDAYLGVSATLALVVGVFSTNYSSLCTSALRGEGQLVRAALLEFLGEAIRVVVSVALFLNGHGVYALLYGFIVGMVGRVLISGYWIDSGIALPDSSAFTSLLSFSRYTFVSKVSGLAYSWLDTLILSYFLSKGVVGVYESAWKISVVTLLASTALGSTLFPAFSRWHSEGRVDYIEDAVTEGVTFTVIIIIPATVGAFLLHDQIMQSVYQFTTGGLVLFILVAEKLFQSVAVIFKQVLLGMDNARQAFYTDSVGLGMNVLLNVLLIHYFAEFGAALATLSSSVLALTLAGYFLRSLITIELDWRVIGWQITAATVMGVVVVAAKTVVPPTSIVTLAFVVVLGAVVYGLLVVAHPTIRKPIYALVTD